MVAKGCPATQRTLEVVVGMAGAGGTGEELASASGAAEVVEAGQEHTVNPFSIE